MNYDEFNAIIDKSEKDDWIFCDFVGRCTYKKDLNVSITVQTDKSNVLDFIVDYFLCFNGTRIEDGKAEIINKGEIIIPLSSRNHAMMTHHKYKIGAILSAFNPKYDQYLSKHRIKHE